jgi:hypothetical protein
MNRSANDMGWGNLTYHASRLDCDADERMGNYTPCWTIQATTLRLQNADEKILRAALEGLGYSNIHVRDEYAARFGATMTADRFSDRTSVKLMLDGQVVASAAGGLIGALDSVAGEVARAYTEQNVTTSARENGWEAEWTTNEAGNRVATVNRGGY